MSEINWSMAVGGFAFPDVATLRKWYNEAQADGKLSAFNRAYWFGVIQTLETIRDGDLKVEQII